MWSTRWPLTDLITFLRIAGLPELHPSSSALAIHLPVSWGVIWHTAECMLVLSGIPYIFSASRCNSRAYYGWVMGLDLGEWESVFMPLWQANAQEYSPPCVLLVNHPREGTLFWLLRNSGVIHVTVIMFLLPYQLLRKFQVFSSTSGVGKVFSMWGLKSGALKR